MRVVVFIVVVCSMAILSSCGSQNSSGLSQGVSKSPSVARWDFSESPLVDSHRSLDVALQGGGFYVVRSPAGETFYTRLGSFIPNPQMGGAWTTRNGFLLQAYAIEEGGGLSRALSSVVLHGRDLVWFDVERNGLIVGASADGTHRAFYKIPLALFDEPESLALAHSKDHIFSATASSGAARLGPARTFERGWLRSFSIEERYQSLLTALPNMRQHALEKSEVSTHLGIVGPGFFVMEDRLDGRKFYSRIGKFFLNSQGFLIDANRNYLSAYLVEQDGKTMSTSLSPARVNTEIFPINRLEIDRLGQGIGYLQDGSALKIFQIPLADFIHPEGLAVFEDFERSYTETEQSGAPLVTLLNAYDGRRHIVSYSLESF